MLNSHSTTLGSDLSRLSPPVTLVRAHVKFCVQPTLPVLHPVRKSALPRQGMNRDQVECSCSALPSLPVQCILGNFEVSFEIQTTVPLATMVFASGDLKSSCQIQELDYQNLRKLFSMSISGYDSPSE